MNCWGEQEELAFSGDKAPAGGDKKLWAWIAVAVAQQCGYTNAKELHT